MPAVEGGRSQVSNLRDGAFLNAQDGLLRSAISPFWPEFSPPASA